MLSAPSRSLRTLITGFLVHGASIPRSMDVGAGGSSVHETTRSTNAPVASAANASLGGPSIWEACLEQVLVCLSLPDRAVRTCLIALLDRLINTSPGPQVGSGGWCCESSSRFAAHLVFPAVVAATTTDANRIVGNAIETGE